MMELDMNSRRFTAPIEVDGLAKSITEQQRDSGEIPWYEGGKTDPWDHVESAIGLTIGGYFAQSRKAFEWLADNQLEDGSWYSAYKGGIPEDTTREANMSSYIAVGMFHYYLVTRDMQFLKSMWPCVRGGIDYALSLQAPSGEIYWARDPHSHIDPMALLTGSSSVYMSLKCALITTALLGEERPDWHTAFERLGDAIRYRPHLFNKSKARFSMDWFYPILAGAITDTEASRRIDKLWNKFVVEGMGVRCVSDRPWITMAETSELVIALAATGKSELAKTVFSWIQNKRFDDGTFWCGVTFPDMVIWPEEQYTWTNAAALMAADALYDLTPASQLFNHALWEKSHVRSPQTIHQYEPFFRRQPAILNRKASSVSNTKDMRVRHP